MFFSMLLFFFDARTYLIVVEMYIVHASIVFDLPTMFVCEVE